MSRAHRNPRTRPPEQQSDPDYLRDGGDLGLFTEEYPTDVGAQVLWTSIRRRALADAMQRAAGKEAIFRVRRVPIRGQALHLHSSEQQHTDDNFTRGTARLGPLAYSLLRGQLLMQEHLDQRLELLLEAYEQLIAGVIGARHEGLDRADWVYRERARLIFWDVLGLLHQISEQLASLFEARQRWIRRDGHLGELMVTVEVQGWKVIQSASFGSAKTWRSLLGIPGASAANTELSTRQRGLLVDLKEKTELLVLADVGRLRQVWTRDLHRVATRHKHAYPVMSASHGMVWLGEDDATREDVRRLVKNSALVVADAAPDGSLEQLVVPVSIGGIEILFDAVRAATRTAGVLVHSILQSAEHESGRVLVIHPDARSAEDVTVDDVAQLVALYCGIPEVALAENPEVEKLRSRAAIATAGARIRDRPG